MSYHPRRRRYRSYRRRSRDENSLSPNIIETLAELIILIGAGLFSVIRWLWRLIGSLRPAAPRPTPPAPSPTSTRASPDRLRFPKAPPLPPSLTAAKPSPPSAAQMAAVNLGLGSPAPSIPQNLPYRRTPHLMTRGERAFWYPLYRAVRGKYRIFCKVRLADIVSPAVAFRDERRWFRKIGSFHVDFVLCEPSTTTPLLVIELDDRSHASPKRQELDRFKESVLASARIPLYRVAAQEAYDPAELARTIERMLKF